MNVQGLWYNELNSVMYLEVDGRTVRGWYISAVGKAEGPYDLIGFVDSGDESPTLGWVVSWQNEDLQARAVTAWCGQAQTIGEKEQLDTTWLLTSSTEEQEDWESTMINKDRFRRIRYSAQEVEETRLTRGVKNLRTIPDEKLPKKN